MSLNDAQWYKDAVIYQVHIKSFFDSNDDGFGDIKGLISKLDYIKQLGVTCIWMLPFYPSPLRDDGYDIADYENVNPVYGDMEDFKELLKQAHDRGLRVITELVINHTSDQHPWFQEARKAPANSEKRNWYVWSDTDKVLQDARIIFIDTEKSNWTWDEEAKAFFWHRFFSHQPDLNFDNPNVLKALTEIMYKWLEMGVDGLRLDAIPYLIEREGTNCENLPETHDVLKKLRKALDEKYPDRIFLAEANQWPDDVRPYFGEGDECHMAFHFPIMPRLYLAIHKEDSVPIIEILEKTPEIPESCQWAMFLRNHDELTLEMVTDEERAYMYDAYAPEPSMRCNVGIRRRLSPLMGNNRSKIELMNALLFSMPGTPIVYYGDELGMGDNHFLPDRHGVRTPMQWDATDNAGFSKADKNKLYLPVIADPVFGYQSVNVEAQTLNRASLFYWMQRIIDLRKKYQVFGRGKFEIVVSENQKVLAFLRKYNDEEILVVANLSKEAQSTHLRLAQYQGVQPTEMFGCSKFPEITDDRYPIMMPAHSFYWLLLKGEHKSA